MTPLFIRSANQTTKVTLQLIMATSFSRSILLDICQAFFQPLRWIRPTRKTLRHQVYYSSTQSLYYLYIGTYISIKTILVRKYLQEWLKTSEQSSTPIAMPQIETHLFSLHFSVITGLVRWQTYRQAISQFPPWNHLRCSHDWQLHRPSILVSCPNLIANPVYRCCR